MNSTNVQFSDRAVQLIEKYSRQYAQPKRAKLLGKILRHWSRAELAEHLSPKPNTQIQNQRNKQLSKVGQQARQLLQAFQSLDEDCRALLAYMMASADAKISPKEQHAEFVQLFERIGNERYFLERLSHAALKALRKPTRRKITTYLVVLDAAAIFEWLTGKDATRIVKDGSEIGPFHDFLASLWPVIFNSGDDGLPAAMKNWASARSKYNERSPLMANIAMRHPRWGVFKQ